MAIEERPRPSRLFPGKPAISFCLFPKLPPEIRIMIYNEAASVARILRLDLGIDTPPPLLHTCSESRAEVQKRFTMHHGKINCDGSEDGTVPTPEAFYRIWINKNGEDILHVTPMECSSFAATRGARLDAFDPAMRWVPSFALNNILAMDTLLWMRPGGGRPFTNLTKIMLESGKEQGGMPDRPDDEEGTRRIQTSAWEVLYERFALADVLALDEGLKRLGIKSPEMLVVWRYKMFDAARFDLNTLEAKAECLVLPTLEYGCHPKGPGCRRRGVTRVREGVKLFKKEFSAVFHVQDATNETAWNWCETEEEPVDEPVWPNVLFLR
ncbi:hypothetical protein DL98DRAFT_659014 [Cadophora sp. DSE1049]|nr:hypothetical protein DL98DRAFT_659014 [Cadophora sp. DSE1049]